MTLDAGALIAVERHSDRMRALLRQALQRGVPVYVPAGVLAQVWRGANRQQPVAALLAHRHVSVVCLDEAQAKAIGELCGRSATSDVVDASVVLCSRLTESTVISSDPADLRRLDPRLTVVPL